MPSKNFSENSLREQVDLEEGEESEKRSSSIRLDKNLDVQKQTG